MPRIRFIKDYVARTNSPDPQDTNNARFHATQEIEVSESSAAHFIKRGVAELVQTAPARGKAKTDVKTVVTEESNADKAAAQDGDAASKPTVGNTGTGGKGGKSL